MSVYVYVNFNGNCREAVEFYAEVFATDPPELMTFGDAPQPEVTLPDEFLALIMHTELTIQGSRVMFSDVLPETQLTVGNNITLAVKTHSIDDTRTFFDLLGEGGTVEMELQETFWSKCYGSVVDKFGVTWQLYYDDGSMDS